MSKTSRGSILIVEDSATAAKRLQMSLKQAGFVVDIARDGKEGWLKAKSGHYDFIITDEQMPKLNGQGLVKCLRAESRYANTPIVFLTASRSALDEEQLNELGVAAILEKPFTPQLVTNFVAKRAVRGLGV